MPQLFYIGIKALIRNAQGLVLLMQADVTNHAAPVEVYWDLPGGRMEPGENVQSALNREIQEETGIMDVPEGTFLTATLSNHTIPYDQGKMAGLMLMVYEINLPAGTKIHVSGEHTAYEWVTLSEAKRRLSHKYQPDFIAKLR